MVVVVTGAGTVVWDDVVDVLCVVSLAQAPRSRTVAARKGTMSFFMSIPFLDCCETDYPTSKRRMSGMGC